MFTFSTVVGAWLLCGQNSGILIGLTIRFDLMETGMKRMLVLGLLGIMQGKALNYNGRLSSWHAGRQTIRPVFDSHNFAFKSTFAEFDGKLLSYIHGV